jgi:hypothetical protein
MIDRLEKFTAPPSWHHFVPGAIIIAITLVACNLDMRSAETDEKVRAESAAKAAQAVAAEQGASQMTLPFAFPLGCPAKDEQDRKLSVSAWHSGERKPRCYYHPVPR